MKWIPLIVVTLLSAGCGGYRLTSPGERVDLGLYSVDPQIVWNIGAGTSRFQGWTIDGWALHELDFIKGLKDGKPLYPILEQKENPPVFRKDMTPHEVVELITASTRMLGAKKVTTTALKPQPFGTLEGFRFEMEYVDESDLEIQGVAAGVVHQDRLYAILYLGAKEYYFPKYRDAVEKLIASIRLTE